jgi:hypothetical protein
VHATAERFSPLSPLTDTLKGGLLLSNEKLPADGVLPLVVPRTSVPGAALTATATGQVSVDVGIGLKVGAAGAKGQFKVAVVMALVARSGACAIALRVIKPGPFREYGPNLLQVKVEEEFGTGIPLNEQ